MSGFTAPAKSAALSADGNANGYVTVASSAGFFVGTRVWLSSATQTSIECFVTELVTGGVIGLRDVASSGYGRTDVSAFLVADAAKLDAPSQFIYGKVQPDPLDLLSSDGTTLTVLGNLVVSGSATDFSLGPVGSTPNANAASITAGVFSLQPASASFPGVVTTAAQTFAGAKSFANGLLTNTIGVTSASGIGVYGAPTDAANAVGIGIGSSTTLANTDAKLVSIKNNSTEKASFDYAGRMTAPDVLTPLMTGGHTVAALATPVNATFATATTGGTLVAGTYYYRVVATNAQGQTLPSTETSKVVPAGTATNTVTVNWARVVGATGYKVYGRSTGAELLMATITDGATLTFVDDGSVTPSGALPTANTTGKLVLTGFNGYLSTSVGDGSYIIKNEGTGGAIEFGVWFNGSAVEIEVNSVIPMTLFSTLVQIPVPLTVKAISYSDYSDGSATIGDATNNHQMGRNTIAAGASSCTINNDHVSSASQVDVVLQTNDATAIIKNVTVGAGGSFVVNCVQATANTVFAWRITN